MRISWEKGVVGFFLPGLLGLAVLAVPACESKTFRQGEILYLNKCANCHMEEGLGLGQLIPPLAGSDWVKENQDKLPCVIRKGMEGPVEVNRQTYNQPMPGVPELSDFEIANIINYINQAWGNDYGYVKFQSVKEALESCQE